jgi:hypothetical protein
LQILKCDQYLGGSVCSSPECGSSDEIYHFLDCSTVLLGSECTLLSLQEVILQNGSRQQTFSYLYGKKVMRLHHHLRHEFAKQIHYETSSQALCKE